MGVNKGYNIEVIYGDITNLGFSVDAIVNATSSSLKGKDGVSGAIHRAGGIAVTKECDYIVSTIGRIETGGSVVTTAGDLDAEYIIHTVGPRVENGEVTDDNAKLLATCYRKALSLADDIDCTSIALPNIATGVFGFPKEDAVKIAFATINEMLKKGFDNLQNIYLVCFDEENYDIYVSNLTLFSDIVSFTRGSKSEDIGFEGEDDNEDCDICHCPICSADNVKSACKLEILLYSKGILVSEPSITLGNKVYDYKGASYLLVVRNTVTTLDILNFCKQMNLDTTVVLSDEMAFKMFDSILPKMQGRDNFKLYILEDNDREFFIEVLTYLYNIRDLSFDLEKDLNPFAEELDYKELGIELDNLGIALDNYDLKTDKCNCGCDCCSKSSCDCSSYDIESVCDEDCPCNKCSEEDCDGCTFEDCTTCPLLFEECLEECDYCPCDDCMEDDCDGCEFEDCSDCPYSPEYEDEYVSTCPCSYCEDNDDCYGCQCADCMADSCDGCEFAVEFTEDYDGCDCSDCSDCCDCFDCCDSKSLDSAAREITTEIVSEFIEKLQTGIIDTFDMSVRVSEDGKLETTVKFTV